MRYSPARPDFSACVPDLGALLVNAVIHVDGSGRSCAVHPFSERDLLNAVDSLQRHLSPMGVRVSFSTRRETVGTASEIPERDLVYINGTEIAELIAPGDLEEGLDAVMMLHAGLAAASDLI